jgi:hypothetical protein
MTERTIDTRSVELRTESFGDPADPADPAIPLIMGLAGRCSGGRKAFAGCSPLGGVS